MTSIYRWFVMDKMNDCSELLKLSSKASNYYQSKLGQQGKVLEIGINEPVLLPALKEAGVSIEGLISNKDYKRTSNAVIHKAEISNFKLPKLYDSIIFPLGLYLSLSERQIAIKALKCFYDHLRPNGTLYIDIYLQRGFEKNKDIEIIRNESFIYICESQILNVDFYNQHVEYLLSLEKVINGELPLTERKLLKFTWFGLKEFKLILERIGYSNIIVTEDYEGKVKTNNGENHQVFTFQASKQV